MDQTSAIILASSLFIIMFGMGLSLTIQDFKRIFQFPKAVVIGLINQIVLLPLVGWVLISIMSVPAEIAVGLMILAACPGGPTSNLITHLAKGDTALSVTLTAISSLITIITIPIIVGFSLHSILGADQEVTLNIPKIIAQLIIIVLIPVSIGMFVHAKAPRFSQIMDKPVKIASAIVLALVIIGILIKEKDQIGTYFRLAGIIALLLNVITMGIGYLSAKLSKLNPQQAISISIESGIQNGTLAIAIATVTLNRTDLATTAAIYSLLMFVTALVVIGIRQFKRV